MKQIWAEKHKPLDDIDRSDGQENVQEEEVYPVVPVDLEPNERRNESRREQRVEQEKRNVCDRLGQEERGSTVPARTA